MPEVILYTRHACPLCDEAADLLRRHGLNPRPVPIDDDPALQFRFDTCVPVVQIDGRIRFRGRVNEVLLRRLLRSLSVPIRA
jgi:glutaredoxin